MADLFLKKDFASIVDSLLDDLSSGRGGRVALTDTTEGSVVRTLVEAFARELAVSYAQLDQVYQLGYLDTARGEALDNVVALLGITRRRGGHFQGTVTFARAQPAAAEIVIPAGTPVAGKGLPPFETTAQVIIPPGGTETTVPVRSLAPPEEELAPEQLGPGVLTVMVRPIHGVESVTNRVRLVPPQRDESDEELRERARGQVAGANQGTPEALRFALRGLGLSRVQVQEPPDRPGTVEVVVGDADFDDAQRERARRVIDEVRPAGVRVVLQGVNWVWMTVTATLELDKAYSEPERQAIEAELRQALQAYVDGLSPQEGVRETKVRNLLAGHPKVLEVYPRVDEADAWLLSAFLEEEGGKARDVSDKRRQPDGVMVVHAGERAGFKRLERVDRPERVEPFTLVLEPPSPKVFIDVELQLHTAVANAEDQLRTSVTLRELLAELGKTDSTLTFDMLVGALPLALRNAASSRRFIVVHERDGRVVLLDETGDQDALLARERPQLRGVVVLLGGVKP